MAKINQASTLVVKHNVDVPDKGVQVKLIVKNGDYVGEFVADEINFESFNGSAQDLYKLINFDRG